MSNALAERVPSGQSARVPFLTVELTVALGLGGDATDREHVARVIEVADRCAAGVHVHLWFIGD